MKVYNKHTTGSLNAHYRYYDFDRFHNDADFTFIDRPQIFTDISSDFFTDRKIVYLELEEPNRFFVNVNWFNHFEYDKYFSKVFSICPYTTEWHNKIYNTNRTHVFIPICHDPQDNEKLFDIIYAGHVYEGNIEEDIKVLPNFNYRLVSNSNHNLITNKSATQKEKLKLISQSKISLVHNLLYPTLEHIEFIKTTHRYDENEAFSLLDKGIVPQIKGRTFEAALCKSLILCQRDPFDVIEKYFEPNKEFIYYDKLHAKEQIQDILNNYNDYMPIIESAYVRAQNYTTEAFFNKYLKDLQ